MKPTQKAPRDQPTTEDLAEWDAILAWQIAGLRTQADYKAVNWASHRGIPVSYARPAEIKASKMLCGRTLETAFYHARDILLRLLSREHQFDHRSLVRVLTEPEAILAHVDQTNPLRDSNRWGQSLKWCIHDAPDGFTGAETDEVPEISGEDVKMLEFLVGSEAGVSRGAGAVRFGDVLQGGSFLH